MTREAHDLTEELRDLIDEISDLDDNALAVKLLDRAMEYTKTVRDICEAMTDSGPETPNPTPTPTSPGEPLSPSCAASSTPREQESPSTP
jgi:hypothetical protein